LWQTFFEWQTMMTPSQWFEIGESLARSCQRLAGSELLYVAGISRGEEPQKKEEAAGAALQSGHSF
jgi:hypothetical protein